MNYLNVCFVQVVFEFFAFELQRMQMTELADLLTARFLHTSREFGQQFLQLVFFFYKSKFKLF